MGWIRVPVSTMNRLRILAIVPLFLALAACDMVVLNPSRDVAAQLRDLLVMSTLLMLLVIVPAIRRGRESAFQEAD